MNILVSACFLGIDCKYNGLNNHIEGLADHLKDINLIPVCPEQLGGLTTPRPPAEIEALDGAAVLVGSTRVMSKAGEDVTAAFIKGARETIKLVKLYGCEAAILKQRSPSCGSREIYDGSFCGTKRKGVGVTVALLAQEGIPVYDEENYLELLKKNENQESI
jgi:uncharacterized protein YbbK (DUF523 family)